MRADTNAPRPPRCAVPPRSYPARPAAISAGTAHARLSADPGQAPPEGGVPMPPARTTNEVRRCRTMAEAMETYHYRNRDDEDDYLSAVLYRLFDDRHFRVVNASGKNSPLAGAGNIREGA